MILFATLSLAFLVGYTIGSIPFGLLLTRLAGLGDIRAVGSGNIGATNVLRTGKKSLAAATLLLDVAKGWLPIVICAYASSAAVIAGALPSDAASHSASAGLVMACAGLGAFLGHCFPVWLGFRGGKGVATFIGVMAGWAWPAALMFCLAWLATAALFRISSLSALVATTLAPIVLVVLSAPTPIIVAAVVLSIVVFVRHSANIERLVSGTEPRIGSKAA
ncbi:MAG: glycerol-3-phosphate 1-O-acyltransferase PlsY [Pseudomonadota bacterium]